MVHPDVNKAPDALEQFYRVQRAYETLIDPQLRLDYDHVLAVDRGLIDEPITIDPAPAATQGRDAVETPGTGPTNRRTMRTYGYGRPVVVMPSYRRPAPGRHERRRRRQEKRARVVQAGFIAASILAGLFSLYQLAAIASFTTKAQASEQAPAAAQHVEQVQPADGAQAESQFKPVSALERVSQ